jgi:hypothetical protein
MEHVNFGENCDPVFQKYRYCHFAEALEGIAEEFKTIA